MRIALFRLVRGRRIVDPRIRRTHLDPFFEVVHQSFWQRPLLFGWHRQVFVCAADRLEDEALSWFSRNQRRPRFTATQDAVPAVEQQLAAQLFRSCRMAFVAVLDQHRTDSSFEELHAPGVCLGRDRVRPKQNRKEKAYLHHDESAHVQESSEIMPARASIGEPISVSGSGQGLLRSLLWFRNRPKLNLFD